MRPYGRGILPESQIHLFDTPEEARGMYFHALCAGHYLCRADYLVNRPGFNSYLLMYVEQGRAFYQRAGRRMELNSGGYALIDCRGPHEYGALEPCELYWLHFDGPAADAMCAAILARGEPAPADAERCRQLMKALCDDAARSDCLDTARVNRAIVDLLTEFLARPKGRMANEGDMIDAIRAYILDNPEKHLTLEALAQRANLSPYHFARVFKRHVGLSPHDYLIHTRLNLAKVYLLSSNNPVKEIAASCGFSSEASFCTTFKNRLGVTPTGFRLNRDGEKK